MKNIEKIENWFFLGSSRGFGRVSVLLWDQKVQGKTFYLVSRKEDRLSELAKKIKNNKVKTVGADFSSHEDQEKLIEVLSTVPSLGVLYFAGGGPHGKFETKKWSSHRWAYEVNFIFPSKLLYFLLHGRENHLFTYIGSSVAESSPDPMASSYAAAKHAMKGLLSSIGGENIERNCLLRLFSPSYMDTKMLPASAWPRQKEGLVQPPSEVGERLYNWLEVSCREDKAFMHFTE